MPEPATVDRATLPGAKDASPSYFRSAWRRFRRHRGGMFGLSIFATLVALAAFAPLLAGSRPIVCRYKGTLFFPAVVDVVHRIPFADRVLSMPKPFRFPQFDPKREIRPADGDWGVWPPLPFGPLDVDLELQLKPPSNAHPFGTDEVGRDVAARMIHATAISLLVGFVSMGIAAVVGITMGSIAGYKGGAWDHLISRLIEIVICFPTFFFILSILVWLPPSIYNVMVVIGLTSWTGIARYTRAEFLKLKTLDYSLAARALGASGPRIVFRHLLPNALTPVMVVVTFGIASAILVEGGLSWLGFGVMAPEPSWGNILKSAFNDIRNSPWLMFPPCFAIFITVLGFNLIGDGLRDVTDPRLHTSG